MSPDQFSEGAFLAFANVTLEQFGIGAHAATSPNRISPRNRTHSCLLTLLAIIPVSDGSGWTDDGGEGTPVLCAPKAATNDEHPVQPVHRAAQWIAVRAVALRAGSGHEFHPSGARGDQRDLKSSRWAPACAKRAAFTRGFQLPPTSYDE
jgi:hypothetical protein